MRFPVVVRQTVGSHSGPPPRCWVFGAPGHFCGVHIDVAQRQHAERLGFRLAIEERSLAVLPFANLSEETSNEFRKSSSRQS